MHNNIYPMTALGLMSSTAITGVAASIIITDGIDIFDKGVSIFRDYPEELRDKIINAGENYDENLSIEVTEFHKTVVNDILDYAKLEPQDIDIIGMHGHTLFMDSTQKKIIQLGSGKLLSELTKIDVVDRFRQVDLATGGKGGPLIPIFYEALSRNLPKPIAISHIGGKAKVTFIGENGELIAFDCGAGCRLLDKWVQTKTGEKMDYDGGFAYRGKINNDKLYQILDFPYFKEPPPKTIERGMFCSALDIIDNLSVEDGAATITAFIAKGVENSLQFTNNNPKQWIFSGGGTKNPTLMRFFKKELNAEVFTSDKLNNLWDVSFTESQCCAFLGVRSFFELPITFPQTTGVPYPCLGGRINFAA